jgi:hypothetical protein
MHGEEAYYAAELEVENCSQGKILLIDGDVKDLEAYSASLRREGHEVRAFASLPEGLSHLQSEHFDLIVVKLAQVSGLEDDRFWSVESRSSPGWSSLWNAVSTGTATWMWRTWERWTC